MGILLLLNGVMPNVMEKQDEDMTSSKEELRDRICQGMVYAKKLFDDLPARLKSIETSGASADGVMATHCCEAQFQLDSGKEWCASVPASLTCDELAELTQSKKYLP